MWFNSVCCACLSRISQCNLVRFRGSRGYTEKAGSTTQDQEKISRKRKYRIPLPRGEILFGLFPVLLAIQQGKRTFHQLYIKDTFQYTVRDDIKALISLAEEKSIPSKYFSHNALYEMSGGRTHQGVCADVSPRSFLSLHPDDEAISQHRLWLFLDSIKDPMNFGAVLRSSCYFGVDKIITTDANSCGLTPVVSKASAGAMEILDVYSVPDSAEFIQAKKLDGWRVLGTGRLAEKPSMELDHFTLDTNTLLLLGNEGEGLSPNLASLCHEFVSINSRKPLPLNFDSLNVSVATGILLHHFLGKKVLQ